MSATLKYSARSIPLLTWLQVKRIGPLGLIIVLHIGFFYALQSGLLQQATQAMPKEIIAFIVPQPAPEIPKPQPAPPKTVPVVKKAVAPPRPPVVNQTPSPQAITPPPAIEQPVQPPVAAVTAPPAPPAPPAPVQPRTISSGVEYVQAPQPDYPLISKRMNEEGKVMLRVLVNEKGRPERVDVQKSSGYARLDEAARQAVLRALFKPHVEDGKPVAVYAIVPIKFQLDN
jgi:protein TonB